MGCSNKKVALSIETKIKLLQDVDSKTMSQVQIAKKYGISKSTVSVMIKNRQHIEEAFESSLYHPSRKRMRTSKNDAVDKALFSWFQQAKAMQMPVTGALLMGAADQLAAEMNVGFSPSTGWLDRFKKRKGITFKEICVESAIIDTADTDDWWSSQCQKLLAEYSPEDIFNANETGFFYKCLPDDILPLKGKVCNGGQMGKDHLTALVAANLTGSQKLSLLVIGEVLKPRCFKNVKSLPVEYTANSKALMSATIFENWLRKLDRMFHSQGRQIALLVSECPAHPNVNNLKAVQLVFLPHKQTSIFQSCDQNISYIFKKHFRKQVVEKYFLHVQNCVSSQCVDKFNINFLDALYMMRTAWNNMTQSVVVNCFRQAGFRRIDSLEDNSNGLIQQAEQSQMEDDIQHLFENLKDILSLSITFDDFCSVDDHIIVCEEFSVKEIANEVTRIGADSDPQGEEEEDGSGRTPSETPVSTVQVREALQVLKTFSLQQEDGDNLVNIMCQLDGTISKILLKSMQSRRTCLVTPLSIEKKNS